MVISVGQHFITAASLGQPRPAIDNVIMEPAEITQAPTHPLSSEQGMSGRLPVNQLLIMFDKIS